MTATTPIAELSKLRGMPLTYALMARSRGKTNVIRTSVPAWPPPRDFPGD